MNSEQEMNFLTNEEMDQIDTLLRIRGIDLERPVRLHKERVEVEAGVDSGTLGRWSYKPGYLLILEQQGKCKLSDETRKMEETWYEEVARKTLGLRKRKRYTRKRGTVHPKKKAATLRRTRMKMWASQPLTCILYRDVRKCKSIDKNLWDTKVLPLWNKYDPADLSIDFPYWAGTKAKPWTLWNMTITHREHGVVWSGEDEYLFYLSGGFDSRTS